MKSPVQTVSALPPLHCAHLAMMLLCCTSLSGCLLPPHSPSRPIKHRHVVHKASSPPAGTQKWNPVWWVGNADDNEPPHWYRPSNQLRSSLWQARNPLHNFTFYVIGIADKDFVRYGREPDTVFARDDGWNWAIIEKGWLRLPFISYQGKHIRFYALWRERGNFGLKLHRRKPPQRLPITESRNSADPKLELSP